MSLRVVRVVALFLLAATYYSFVSSLLPLSEQTHPAVELVKASMMLAGEVCNPARRARLKFFGNDMRSPEQPHRHSWIDQYVSTLIVG
jgi:hypothetical protein